MLRSRATAASHDVQQPTLCHDLDLSCHVFRALVISSHLVRQTGIRVAAHCTAAPFADVLHQRHELGCTEGAVEPESEEGIVQHRSIECLQCLTGQRAAASVTYGYGHDYRHRI